MKENEILNGFDDFDMLLEEAEDEDDWYDDEGSYIKTPWQSLSFILNSYGIKCSDISVVMGNHIADDLLNDLSTYGYLQNTSENKNNNSIPNDRPKNWQCLSELLSEYDISIKPFSERVWNHIINDFLEMLEKK